MNFPGSSGLPGRGPAPDPNEEQMKKLKSFGESCAAKTVMSGVAGLGLGAVFGLFMASMAYDTPFHHPTPDAAKAAAPKPPYAAGTGMVLPRGNYSPPTITPPPMSSLPMKTQIAAGFRDMGARSVSTGKNFGKVGAMFSGIECGIEGLRAKNDAGNGVAAGCVTGAILARNGGPQAAAIGCAGFAAFSAAIEMWLRSPKDE
ncbi:Mitochondrial import inner membrane translocase subunit tim22 [Pyricularia oryzae]|uniref:Mitochondrial import inner membrane translocase subunit TIM22 n=5 Tax=Pyricularia TaxID=48558 RepID=A0ABQ8P0D9_PYRGI|nr:mitochondrial import inner membrane translocase subunit tim-22 [Pyricularia oryzae 70-15]ELQ38116.1 mitochondrial import inner membrane translocase subunit tim-22 [Pyricularia oryzae Y34]KAH8846718.1 Mitochondrial import inner membrane translocase subunit tim22 [Pyricularia oryzae]KAI6304754.1 Mitochondrial import inner membrane translocase subunit tim22 [Pyricularia grisea]EHA51566.1 mitochondrial import inner membrane translocase subunit tim-22 [Pyricularia oryzae 70-15]KAH9428121.1 Mitoc